MSSILIAFGLAWMVVSAFLGLYLGAKHDAHNDKLDVCAQTGDLVLFHRTLEAYKWRGTVHAHGMLFSLSSIVVGVILPLTGLGQRSSEILIASLVFATIIWTLSAMKRFQLLMGFGDLLFVGSIAVAAWGVAKNAVTA